MPDAKVSVVIPAKNAESTIGRAVMSIAAQYAPPFEVVVVDNGSTDDTVRTAEAHAAGLILRVVDCKKPGSGAARNAGILAASGDAIAFLDADDVWYPNKLSSQLHQLNDQQSAFSGTYMHYLSSTGRVLGNNVRYKDEDAASRALRSGEAMPVPLSSVLIGVDLIEHAGLFNESFRRAQDFEWLTRISARADLRIPGTTPLVGYVLQSGSSSDDAYIEQGLAADAVRLALKTGTTPDYQQDVVEKMASRNIPRKYAAGQHYRRAGTLIGQRQYISASSELAKSFAIDPVGTVSKLKWQSVGRSRQNLPAGVDVLFAEPPTV